MKYGYDSKTFRLSGRGAQRQISYSIHELETRLMPYSLIFCVLFCFQAKVKPCMSDIVIHHSPPLSFQILSSSNQHFFLFG